MEAFRSAVERMKDVAARFDVMDRIAELGPLHRAVALEDEGALTWLLERGADPDDDDGTAYGFTTAHWAAMRCGEKIIRLLFDHGANMSAADHNGLTPLHVAAMSGNIPALSWLLENTRDMEAREEYGQTPLHQAALNGKLEAAEVLVEAGAALEAADIFDLTPICLAAVRGFPAVVGFLLERGADCSVRDRCLKTLLHVAAATDQTVLIGWFLSRGVAVDTRDRWECTPLHDAAKNGSCDAINLLLDRGADSCAVDCKGCTPACKAKNAGEMKALKLLLRRIAVEKATRVESKDATAPKEGNSKVQMKRGKSDETIPKNDITSLIKKKKLLKKNQRRKIPTHVRKNPPDAKGLPVVCCLELKKISPGHVKHLANTRGSLEGKPTQAGGVCRHVKFKILQAEDSSSSEEEDKTWSSIVTAKTGSGNGRNHAWEEEMDSALAKLTYQDILRIIF